MQDQLNNLNVSFNGLQQALNEVIGAAVAQINEARSAATQAQQQAAEERDKAFRERDEAREARRRLARAVRPVLKRAYNIEMANAVGQKAGKVAVDDLVKAAAVVRDEFSEDERDPDLAAERAEYEALVRQQQDLAAQLEAKAKLMAELGG